jgi:hypothetical protein
MSRHVCSCYGCEAAPFEDACRFEERCARLEDALAAMTFAMGEAMESLERCVGWGRPPRGVEMLRLITLASEAADKRDAVMVGSVAP